MRRGRLAGGIVLLAAVPVVAFVFVPYKTDRLDWSAKAVDGGTCWVAGAPGGDTYVARPDLIEAYTSLHGDKRWDYRPPEGAAFREPPQAGRGLVVTAPRTDADEVELLALSAAPGPDGAPRVVWRRTLPGVPVGGFYLPPPIDAAHPSELLAVLSRDRLLLLGLADGLTKAEQVIGTIHGRPMWVEDSGFVVTTADADAQPKVVGFEVPPGPDPGDLPPAWHWPVPAGEAVQSVEWIPNGRVLAVHGRERTYLFQ
ncbi:MAG: hypothetical protein HYU66_25620 [Armatimonadetes bacterium]|nr:hypothetical protein [Armatimonadota bacterium]